MDEVVEQRDAGEAFDDAFVGDHGGVEFVGELVQIDAGADEAAGADGGDGQQDVVERAELVFRDDDHRQPEVRGEAGNAIVANERNLPTAGSLDDDFGVLCGEFPVAIDQYRGIDHAVFQHGGYVRGDGRVEMKGVEFFRVADAGRLGEQAGVIAIPAGNGFVAHDIPPGLAQDADQKAGDVGFADARVRPGDEIAHAAEVPCRGPPVKMRLRDFPFPGAFRRHSPGHMTADFLVIGAGIAGLSFALRAAKHGTVIVLTKGTAYESNTAWAQGGIASVLPEDLRDPGDTLESHIADTLDAGAGLCNEAAVRMIVGEGAATIDDLLGYGVSFDRENDHFQLGKEGGHSHRRILHARDTTGHEIARALIEEARATPNITLLEHHFVIDLITSAKLGRVVDPRVLGAYVLETKTGEVRVFRSDRVVLAAGGCGKVYLYTTNPDSATGDAVALGWRAGASVANMEFIQFHPTCFYNPGATGPEARSFLVSEAVRGEGGILINAKGEDFTKKSDPRGSLAPRDIVARAIDQEIKRTGAACVYLDVTHEPDGFMKERFPHIYQTLLKFGFDCETQPIPVVPAAHYQCGGVLTDTNGRTCVRGLYAIGEAACTGLHGANRLASNSLLEGNVMARRAVAEMMLHHPPGGFFPEPPAIPEWEHGDTAVSDELVVIYHNWDEIRRLMWDYVSIVRTDNRLRRAAARLRNLKKEVREFYWGHRVNADILELRNLVAAASLIVESATRRKESRGLHFTSDHPATDPLQCADTVLRKF